MMRTIYCLAIIVFILTLPTRAYACSCIPWEEVEAGFSETDVIFRGTAVDTRNVEVEAHGFWQNLVHHLLERRYGRLENHFYETQFEIDTVMNGQWSSRVFTVRHAIVSASCGVEFPAGQRFYVIAQKRDGFGYGTSSCSSRSMQAE